MADLAKTSAALASALNFRSRLLLAAGVDPSNMASDKRHCYELITQLHALDTRNPKDRELQSACQVVDACLDAFTS